MPPRAGPGLIHELNAHMKALGSEEPSFKTILHGGGNTTLPHSGPLPYRIQAGDPLLIDFGVFTGSVRSQGTQSRLRCSIPLSQASVQSFMCP